MREETGKVSEMGKREKRIERWMQEREIDREMGKREERRENWEEIRKEIERDAKERDGRRERKGE